LLPEKKEAQSSGKKHGTFTTFKGGGCEERSNATRRGGATSLSEVSRFNEEKEGKHERTKETKEWVIFLL